MNQLLFQEWLPDLGDLNNPGSLTVKNCLPEGRGYSHFKTQAAFGDALNDYCRGAHYAQRLSTDDVYNFAGTSSRLYLMEGAVSSTWDNITRAAGTYPLRDEDYWEFTQFGDQVIATTQWVEPQVFTLSSSALFENLANAPRAKCCNVVRDFLVFGSTKDSTDGLKRSRVRWPGIGTTDSWTVSATTQADYQDLQEVYGGVNAIAGGEVGYIFQEKAITRMSYVGTPAIFQFDVVEVNKGTRAGRSVVQEGGMVYYLGLDGFYVFDGSRSTAIGELRIDEEFFADLDENYYHRVVGQADPKRKVIYWAYPGAGNTGGRPNKILAYNYAEGALTRWSIIEEETECLWLGINPDYTLEDLDSISASLDALPESLDSVAYKGGEFFLGAFNSSHYATKFNGTAKTAVIETGESNFNTPLRTVITRLRPMVEGATSVTAEIGTRNNLADAVTYTGAISQLANGSISCRTNARYHRVKFNITGDFTNAMGTYVEASTTGGMR